MFNFLRTGKQLPEHLGDFQSIAESLGNTGLEKDVDGSGNLSLSSIPKMLMIIYEKLQDGLLFSKNDLVNIPYMFDLININFENADGFQILTNKDITIQPFTSDRVKFSFACHINQMLVFEPNPDIESLGRDMAYQLPSFYQFEEVIVNNFQNTPKRRSGTAGLPTMYLKDINPPVKYKL